MILHQIDLERKNLKKNNIKSGLPLFGKLKLRKEETLKIYPDTSKAKKFLNWKPKIKLDDLIFEMIEEETKISNNT